MNVHNKGYLAQNEYALLGTGAAAFEHEEVILYCAVVREAAHRSDALLARVLRSAASLLVTSFAQAIDLLVDFRALEVALLASARLAVANAC